MRIFNRAHLPWFIFVVLTSAAASLLYLANFYPGRISVPLSWPRLTGETPGYVKVGATPLGLLFGSVAFAIFIFAGLLGLRKKVRPRGMRTIQRWLRAHIWLTLLTIPLVLFHAGFRLGGPMTTLLMLLYALVMVSGIYGLVLQHQLPKLMKEKLPTEPVYEQITHLRAQLYNAAECMRAALRPPAAASPAVSVAVVRQPNELTTPDDDLESKALLLEFLERHVLPYFRQHHGRAHLANRRYADDVFRFLKLRIAEEYREDVEKIETWCEERRLLDYQVRLQHWLHAWLFVHVPFSYLLLLFTAWHAFVTLFRY